MYPYYTDLHKAIRDGSLKAVNYLVEHGADIEHRDFFGIEHRDFFGNTPLCTAAESRSLEMVIYLIGHGANVNSEGTPLHCAVKYGSLEIVKYLVEHGADIELFWKHSSLHSCQVSLIRNGKISN